MMGLLETKEPMEGEERKEVEWNGTPHPWNLYKPRMVRGVKLEKEGLCPICVESVERGGEGEAKWLKVRFSPAVFGRRGADAVRVVEEQLVFVPPFVLSWRRQQARRTPVLPSHRSALHRYRQAFEAHSGPDARRTLPPRAIPLPPSSSARTDA